MRQRERRMSLQLPRLGVGARIASGGQRMLRRVGLMASRCTSFRQQTLQME